MTSRTAAFARRIRSRYARAERRAAPGRFSVVRVGGPGAVSPASAHASRWELRVSLLTRHAFPPATAGRPWRSVPASDRGRTAVVRSARPPAAAVPTVPRPGALRRTQPVPPMRTVAVAAAGTTVTTPHRQESIPAPVPRVVVRTVPGPVAGAAAQRSPSAPAAPPPSPGTPVPGWGAPILTSPAPPAAGAPDLRRLAEQVAVHLERRSLAERERRGRF